MKEKQSENKIQVRFPSDVLEHLRMLAKSHQRSFNGEVIWALRQYVVQQMKIISEKEENNEAHKK